MRLSCQYAELFSNLNDVATVVDDAMSSEDAKNIIFQFGANGVVTLIGLSQLITFKRRLPLGSYQLTRNEGEAEFMQIKSKELLGFLGSYKSIRKTTVDEVIFEFTERGGIKCTVVELLQVEEGMGAEPERYFSSWVFTNIAIKPNLLPIINIAPPQGTLTYISRQAFETHTKNMFPIMQNGTTLYSYMMLDKDYAVVFNAAFTVLMRNVIGEGGILTGLKLPYKVVSFVDKLIGNVDSVGVARMERHIYMGTDDSDAFLIYDTTLAPYQTLVDAFKKEHVVTTDRVYLKDVIKRLSLVNESIELSVHADSKYISLRNSKFSQDIAINYVRGMEEVPKVTFKIMPEVLDKAIIGSDDAFVNPSVPYGSDVFIYYCPNGANSVIIISDASGMWFSVIKVKVY